MGMAEETINGAPVTDGMIQEWEREGGPVPTSKSCATQGPTVGAALAR